MSREHNNSTAVLFMKLQNDFKSEKQIMGSDILRDILKLKLWRNILHVYCNNRPFRV